MDDMTRDREDTPRQAFERVLRLIEPLGVDDAKPLRDVIPGAWPSVGELRALLATSVDKPA